MTSATVILVATLVGLIAAVFVLASAETSMLRVRRSAVLVEAARRGYTVRGNDLSIVPFWYSKGVFEGAQLSDDDVETSEREKLEQDLREEHAEFGRARGGVPEPGMEKKSFAVF